jgi:hypothetical protein
MFQFGLFSTFIPYLLITIAYLGFIGSNALEKNQYIYQSNVLSSYDISFTDNYSEIISISQTKLTNSYDSFLYWDYQDFSCIETRNEPTDHINIKIQNLLLSSFILSRPPPNLV